MVAETHAVLGHRATEVDHRAGEANDLLDRTRHVGVEVGLEERLLVGVLGEKGETPRDGVAARLVAGGAQQHEEALEFLTGQLVAVDLGVDEGVGEVVGVLALGMIGDLVHQPGQGRTGAEKRLERVLPFGHELGVPLAQDDVRHVEDELVLALGDAHHVADDLHRQPRGTGRHEVAARALLAEPLDDLLGRHLDVLHVPLQHPRGEPGRHQFAQAGVAGVVHRDHRAEELVEFLGQIGDVDALARLEQLRVAAGLDDVGVLGDGPVAGARRQVFVLVLGEVADRVLSPQRLECGVANRHWLGPEPLDVGKVDVGELHGQTLEDQPSCS